MRRLSLLVMILFLFCINVEAKNVSEVRYMEQEKGFITEEQGRFLLKVARETIEAKLLSKDRKRIPLEGLPDELKRPGAAFVTITENGQLRGCIGHIIAREPLIRSVEDNAVAAAFEDPRFLPLRKEELKKIKIEVSVLTEPKPLRYKDAEDLLDKLRPGTDGVIIKKGPYSATFLPQVWEQLPNKELFLEHLCLKAGLPSDEWKRGNLKVLIYQVQAFEEE